MGGPGSGRRKKTVVPEAEREDPGRSSPQRVEGTRGSNPVPFPEWEEVKRERMTPEGEWVTVPVEGDEEEEEDVVFLGTIPDTEEELDRVLAYAKGVRERAAIRRKGPVTRSRSKRVVRNDPCKEVTPKKGPRKDDDGAGPSKMSGGKTPSSTFPPFYYYVG